MSAATDLASEPVPPVTTHSVRLLKVLMVVSILPAVQFVRIAIFLMLMMFAWLRSRTNAARGLCVACGYDLRATRDRCPECGKIVVTTHRVQKGATMGAARELPKGEAEGPDRRLKSPVRWTWYAGLIGLLAWGVAVYLIRGRDQLIFRAEYVMVFFPLTLVAVGYTSLVHLILATAWILPPQSQSVATSIGTLPDLPSPVIRWTVTIIVSAVFATFLYCLVVL